MPSLNTILKHRGKHDAPQRSYITHAPHPPPHPPSYPRTHARTHTHTRARAHTHTYTHARAHTYTHTRTHKKKLKATSWRHQALSSVSLVYLQYSSGFLLSPSHASFLYPPPPSLSLSPSPPTGTHPIFLMLTFRVSVFTLACRATLNFPQILSRKTTQLNNNKSNNSNRTQNIHSLPARSLALH